MDVGRGAFSGTGKDGARVSAIQRLLSACKTVIEAADGLLSHYTQDGTVVGGPPVTLALARDALASAAVDMESILTPVADQGKFGSSSGHAAAACLERERLFRNDDSPTMELVIESLKNSTPEARVVFF